MTDIIVWTEIPAADLPRAVAFYNAVFGWEMEIDTSGPNPMAMLGGSMDGAGGHLYPGTPGAGPTPHIAVADLEAARDRVGPAGGRVVMPDPVEIPPGRFVYVEDSEGNSLGLFEPKAA